MHICLWASLCSCEWYHNQLTYNRLSYRRSMKSQYSASARYLGRAPARGLLACGVPWRALPAQMAGVWRCERKRQHAGHPVLTPTLTGMHMLVATSVFFSGQGALLQDAVSIGAAPILQISCAVTDAQRESRSSGPATSSLIAGRPACCHVVPVYMAVDTSEAHTPSWYLIFPPIASRMAKFDSPWLFSRNRFHPVRTT